MKIVLKINLRLYDRDKSFFEGSWDKHKSNQVKFLPKIGLLVILFSVGPIPLCCQP